jgi:CheY-like chemotaxis protein
MTAQTLPHILLVEDDVQLQSMYKRKFEYEHFQVTIAGTGKDALQALTDSSISIILLDIMLPGGMNGFDVLEQVKTNPDIKDLPVIMMTNLDSEREQALQMGAVAYFVKAETPLDVLVEEIKKLSLRT